MVKGSKTKNTFHTGTVVYALTDGLAMSDPALRARSQGGQISGGSMPHTRMMSHHRSSARISPIGMLGELLQEIYHHTNIPYCQDC